MRDGLRGLTQGRCEAHAAVAVVWMVVGSVVVVLIRIIRRPLHVDFEEEVAEEDIEIYVDAEGFLYGVDSFTGSHCDLYARKVVVHGGREARDACCVDGAAATDGAAHVVGVEVDGEGADVEYVSAGELGGVARVCRVQAVDGDVGYGDMEHATQLVGARRAEEDVLGLEGLARPRDVVGGVLVRVADFFTCLHAVGAHAVGAHAVCLYFRHARGPLVLNTVCRRVCFCGMFGGCVLKRCVSGGCATLLDGLLCTCWFWCFGQLSRRRWMGFTVRLGSD